MKANYAILAMAFGLLAAVSPGQADPFTRPTATGLVDYVVQATRCGDALQQREEAATGSQVFLPYSGKRQPLVQTMQERLESLALLYVNHTNATPWATNGSDLLYFTLATWRTTAPLNADGYRRYDRDGNASGYGIAQATNAIGAEVFEDLRKGINALQWTGIMNAWDTALTNFFRYGEAWSTNLNTAKTAAESAYTIGVHVTHGDYYPRASTYIIRAGNNYHVRVVRSFCRLKLSGMYTGVTKTIDVYTLGREGPQGLQMDGFWEQYPNVSRNALFDDYGDNVGNNAYSLYDSVTNDVSVEKTWLIGDTSMTRPAWCDTPPADSGNLRGYWGLFVTALLKWDFTALPP